MAVRRNDRGMHCGREASGRSAIHGVMSHSDQGGLYRCRELLRFARERRVVRSMSGRGSCYDNAVIESHFGNLKGRLGRLDSVPEGRAREMIDEAVKFFNEERIQLKLGGFSPAEYLRVYEKRRKPDENRPPIYNLLPVSMLHKD